MSEALPLRRGGTSRLARGLVIAGAFLIVVSVSAHTASSVVHDRLLKASLYDDALVRERVFGRIYSEVLTDEAVREFTDNLLGGLDVPGERSLADSTALSNAITRLALPPATLRTAAHRVVEAILAYLRGDTDELDATVDLSAVLQLNSSVRAALIDILQNASTVVMRDLPSYQAAVRAFADDLAAGRVPEFVPVVGGTAVSESEIIAAIDAAGRFGLPESVASQVVAAVRSGDERDALITASAEFVRTHVQALLANLEQGTELRIDVVDALGEQAGQPQQQVIGQMNSVRRLVRWFPRWIAWLSLFVAALGVGMITFALGRRQRALVVLAGVFVGSGVFVWLASRLVGRLLDSPLERAATGGGSNGLPASVVTILGDVDRSIGDDLLSSVDRRVIWLLIIGTGCAVAAGASAVFTWARRTDWRVVAPLMASGVLLVGLAVPEIASARTTPTARECNGHPELCDRPYNHVVQAATHNSMSSPDVVQIWPEHDGNIQAQLDFGVRTLLIDTHYWTEIETPAELSSFEQPLPADIAAYLYRTLDRRLAARPGAYLCHSRCAYGAVPLRTSLETIKRFLQANPDEVVTLIIQNGITTADTAEAFAASGIDAYLYHGTDDGDWPTLGTLIDTGQRLVVFAETAEPPPDWYHSYSDFVQDTDYRVQTVADFSCELGRGSPDAPLFLMNHWIQREAPDRADAVVVNRSQFIVERALRCATERNHLPNFIAVNFFGIGDVLAAVDELNGLSR